MREYADMVVVVKLRIANGCGDAVRDAMKENLGSGLRKNSQGCIKVTGKLKEHMPNNGWTGFDWYGALPITVNISKLLDIKCGEGVWRRFVEGAMKFFGGRKSNIAQKLAETLVDEIEKSIKDSEAGLDFFKGAYVTLCGGAVSVERVGVKVTKGTYFK